MDITINQIIETYCSRGYLINLHCHVIKMVKNMSCGFVFDFQSILSTKFPNLIKQRVVMEELKMTVSTSINWRVGLAFLLKQIYGMVTTGFNKVESK